MCLSNNIQCIHDIFNLGYASTWFRVKNATPRQPTVSALTRGSITISKEIFSNAAHSLENLSQFSHAWYHTVNIFSLLKIFLTIVYLGSYFYFTKMVLQVLKLRLHHQDSMGLKLVCFQHDRPTDQILLDLRWRRLNQSKETLFICVV